MKAMGLQGVVRGKKVITTQPDTARPCPDDKVNRLFVANRPNQLWVSDFTFVSTWQGTIYVAFVIDVFAPHHQPHNLAAIAALGKLDPTLPQVACFDTAFHTTQSATAKRLPLPREYADTHGLQRYGFHGLSYAFIRDALARRDDVPDTARILIAHLGHGASLCATRAGRSVATTMGFSTLDGLMMGTGGVGENAATVRARIADRLTWLGMTVSASANAAHADLISTPDSSVKAWVIPTNEELAIARLTRAALARSTTGDRLHDATAC